MRAQKWNETGLAQIEEICVDVIDNCYVHVGGTTTYNNVLGRKGKAEGL